jgi:hypothetical protein
MMALCERFCSASHFIIRGCLLSVPYRKALVMFVFASESVITFSSGVTASYSFTSYIGLMESGTMLTVCVPPEDFCGRSRRCSQKTPPIHLASSSSLVSRTAETASQYLEKTVSASAIS